MSLVILYLFLIPYTYKSSLAQTTIKTSGHWEANTHGSGKSKTCYLASQPIKETGKYKKRGKTFVLVANRPLEKQYDVFELRAGYVYKKNSVVNVKIDDKTFQLFTDGSTAWAKTSKIDRKLSQAMIRGKKMVVLGTSKRGTKTIDTYSLSGFTVAYRAIHKACKQK